MSSPSQSSLDSRLSSVRSAIGELKSRLRAVRAAKCADVDWASLGTPSTFPFAWEVRRRLRGHFGKLYALAWGADSTSLVTASQDGTLILWNGMRATKLQAVHLKSAWVMTVAATQGGDAAPPTHVACGGLDNVVSVYDVKAPALPVQELVGHSGYISSVNFLDPQGRTALSSSGDGSLGLWDVGRGIRSATFGGERGNAADVMDAAACPVDANLFVSGACDASVRLWDIRTRACVARYTGHMSDVNAVTWFPSGCVFASGSEDASVRLWDIRGGGVPVHTFSEERVGVSVTDLCFSKGGGILFAAYSDSFVLAWEVVSSQGVFHELRANGVVSALGVNPNGLALATACWDSTALVWA